MWHSEESERCSPKHVSDSDQNNTFVIKESKTIKVKLEDTMDLVQLWPTHNISKYELRTHKKKAKQNKYKQKTYRMILF